MALCLAELTDAGARELGLHDRNDLVRAIRSGIGDMVRVRGHWRARVAEMPLPLMDAAVAAGALIDADALRDAVEHGDLKPQTRFDGHIRFLPSDVAAWARALKGSPLTEELDAQLAPPLLEEYVPPELDTFLPNPMGLRNLHVARDKTAAARAEAEFQATLPKPRVTTVDGIDEIDPTSLLTPEEIVIRRQAFNQQRAAKADAERYDRLHARLS